MFLYLFLAFLVDNHWILIKSRDAIVINLHLKLLMEGFKRINLVAYFALRGRMVIESNLAKTCWSSQLFDQVGIMSIYLSHLSFKARLSKDRLLDAIL